MKKEAIINKLDDIYKKPGESPWTYPQPHEEIIRLVQNKKIRGKNILEIGCGEGTHAIYLAQNGYHVTAIDESRSAIENARNTAEKYKTRLIFEHTSLEEYIEKYRPIHETVIDWRVMHEYTNKVQRENYIEMIAKTLLPGGRYITSAFSSSAEIVGKGNKRATETNIPLYFASLDEMQNMLKKHFSIVEAREIIVPQKPNYKIKSYFIIADRNILN